MRTYVKWKRRLNEGAEVWQPEPDARWAAPQMCGDQHLSWDQRSGAPAVVSSAQSGGGANTPTPPPTKKRLFHQPNISHHQQHSVLQTSRRLKTEAISHDSATTPINPNFNPPETKLRFHLFHLQRVFPQLCTTLFSFLRFSRFELSLTFSFLIIST